MGIALSGGRLAVDTAIQVWEFVNDPVVAARLEPPGRHDACSDGPPDIFLGGRAFILLFIL
jgi:hypothetical protein